MQVKLTAFLTTAAGAAPPPPPQQSRGGSSAPGAQMRLQDMGGVLKLPRMSGHATVEELWRLHSLLESDSGSSEEQLVHALKQLACYECTVEQVCACVRACVCGARPSAQHSRLIPVLLSCTPRCCRQQPTTAGAGAAGGASQGAAAARQSPGGAGCCAAAGQDAEGRCVSLAAARKQAQGQAAVPGRRGCWWQRWWWWRRWQQAAACTNG